MVKNNDILGDFQESEFMRQISQRGNLQLQCDNTGDFTLYNACKSDDFEMVVKGLDRWYKDELLYLEGRFGPSEEESFAYSFHRLVHSTSFPEVLQSEKNYAQVIADLNRRMQQQLQKLASEQETEMELGINQLDISITPENINALLTDQCMIRNHLQKKFESEIEATMGHQKFVYRKWITREVCKRFRSRVAATPLESKISAFAQEVPCMEESFTIHLGSQLKHMHNIRILSADVTDFCTSLHSDLSFSGLNIALGLYSNSLCGVVVLTSSPEIEINPSIIRNANMSTEFHFDQVTMQLHKMKSEVQSKSRKSFKLKEGTKFMSHLKSGDFFITKHSNLSQSHVIFHLISDEPLKRPCEINSRHPVFLGLRNILKTASQQNVTMLTIPALLRHEMSEEMTVQWCVRRAELVYKCAKGFMIESSSWGGAELNTLQLLLPSKMSEDLFLSLAGMIPHVFRVANPKILVDRKTNS